LVLAQPTYPDDSDIIVSNESKSFKKLLKKIFYETIKQENEAHFLTIIIGV